MKYLFSEPGLQILESLSFTETLYAFDFDGTLSPIVSHPENAQAGEITQNLLKELSNLRSVVVISGRAVSDLKTRVQLKENLLIGNHGLEGLGVKKATIQKAKVICERWQDQLKKGWSSLKNDPGVMVENKTYSIALHYRKSRNKNQARAKLFELIGDLQPSPRVILGKCVFNIVPAGGPHKGVALLEAMLKLERKCALYIGDDDTDEDVFSLPDARIISVRVGKKRDSQAQFYINRQSEINRLLKVLLKLKAKV